jgi:hypothetical protein
VNLWHV